MPFDAVKVNWSDEEIRAAEGLDRIYEGLADGIDPDDLLLIMEVLPLWEFLKSDSRREYAEKISALAMLIYRDNADDFFPIPE